METCTKNSCRIKTVQVQPHVQLLPSLKRISNCIAGLWVKSSAGNFTQVKFHKIWTTECRRGPAWISALSNIGHLILFNMEGACQCQIPRRKHRTEKGKKKKHTDTHTRMHAHPTVSFIQGYRRGLYQNTNFSARKRDSLQLLYHLNCTLSLPSYILCQKAKMTAL